MLCISLEKHSFSVRQKYLIFERLGLRLAVLSDFFYRAEHNVSFLNNSLYTEIMEIGQYNFEQVEKSVLAFWKNSKIYNQIKERNKKGKKFYFLQGPPYTSGRLHMAHAWNNGLKDLALRYKRMQGFNVWDRAGYDMHGLPTEHKVQSKLNLKDKEEIKKFGLDKFAEECMDWSIKMAKIMDDDLQRFGVWLDYSDPYYPVNNDFIEGEWWLIKKAHEKKRLYKGKRALSWCPSCATAVAKHEQEYKKLQDNSIYVKLKVFGKENEYLIVWTTTPWTIAFNLAVMVNPDLDYVKIKVFEEKWIVAKDLANQISQIATKEDAKILEEFKGVELEGLEYIHPWNEQIDYKSIKKEHPKVHTVILSKEYVETSSGTGLVHCAPGCGPEDFEIGHRNNIPPFNSIDEYGVFQKEMSGFAGLIAKKDDKIFIEKLKESGALVHSAKFTHDYAHCERCKSPVVFRSTEQWFFKVEDLIEKMIELNKEVHWIPDSGSKAFDLWIENLRDNSITKQRFWGTPVPIWECNSCSDFTVVGSLKELEELSGKSPENLHKPWIDEVSWQCSCGGTKKRIPDILDVWIDSATTSWNCLYYPKREDLFNKFFPADFILEASEQVRLWFYMLLLGSVLAMDKHSYENVYMHGMLFGVDGVKMSKSLGNIISPYEIVDKYGADTMRSYLCSINAGSNISFSWNEVTVKNRNLSVLWNLHKYLIETAEFAKINPRNLGTLEEDLFGVEEKFILSKAHSTLKRTTKLLDKYQLDQVSEIVEDLFLTLSRTYIQLARDKLSSDTEDRSVSLYCIYKVLMMILKMYSIICPFITESIYQNLRSAFDIKEESIHVFSWPEYSEENIDIDLEDQMYKLNSIIQAGLAAREKINITRRWPIKEIIVETHESNVQKAVENLQEVIKKQINVKAVKVQEEFHMVKKNAKPDFKSLKESFDKSAGKIISYLQKKDIGRIFMQVEQKGKYSLVLDDEVFDLMEKHFLIEREVPEPYKEETFKGGVVYISRERSEELETEGYVREIMRRIQSLRKDAGLKKQDKIKLFIAVPSDIYAGIRKWDQEIIEKTGSTELILETHDEKITETKYKESIDIKGNKFILGFNMI